MYIFDTVPVLQNTKICCILVLCFWSFNISLHFNSYFRGLTTLNNHFYFSRRLIFCQFNCLAKLANKMHALSDFFNLLRSCHRGKFVNNAVYQIKIKTRNHAHNLSHNSNLPTPIPWLYNKQQSYLTAEISTIIYLPSWCIISKLDTK